MASTLPTESTTAPHLLSSHSAHTQATQATPPTYQPHDILANFNYYKDPGDGSTPQPSYVGKPETYERPSETLALNVHDIRGEEDKYSLDKNGFEILRHVSEEKAFEDEEEIKRVYYPEVEGILKSA